MCPKLLGIVTGKSLLQRQLCLAFRVTADVVIVDEIRGSGQIDGSGGGMSDAQTIVLTHRFAVGFHSHLAHGMQSGLYAFLFFTLTDHRQLLSLSLYLVVED